MKKKITFLKIKHVFLVTICLLSIYGHAQTSWDWSKKIHTTSDNIGNSKLSYGNNSVLISGVFSSNINLNGTNYYGNDLNTAFVASLLPNGQLQWFKKSGEPFNYNLSNNIQIHNLFSMPNNDIVSFGFYSYKLVFDGISIQDHQVHANGTFSHYPVFAFRFNSPGNPINAINITSYGEIESPVACIDNIGNLYISAFYNDSVFINNSDTLLPVTQNSVFIAKFNTQDSLTSVVRLSSSSAFFMNAMNCNQNGDIIICGKAGNEISIGNNTFGYNNTQYSFIARLTNTGDLVGWTGFISNSQLEITDLEEVNNKIYFTGIFYNDSILCNGSYTVYPNPNYNVLYGYASLSMDTVFFKTNLGEGDGKKIIKGKSGSTYLYLEKYTMEVIPFIGPVPIPTFKVIKLNEQCFSLWSVESSVPSYSSFAFDMIKTPYDEILITGLFSDDIGFGSDVYSNPSGQSLFLAKFNQTCNINFNGYVYNNWIPSPNTLVEFLRFEGNSKTFPIGSCYTDNFGHYNYNDSVPGNYYVRAIPDISMTGTSLTYAPSYAQWNNSTGNQVTGDSIINGDIILTEYVPFSGPNTIHGYVKDPFGNSQSQIKVNLMDDIGLIYATTFTDNFGYYSFSNVSGSNFNVLIDQPFLPHLNSYIPNDYLLDYNYRIFPNFIDTGCQYLPQPTDTIGINISTCEIDPNLPIDSAFAYIVDYVGNQVIIYIQVYQLSNSLDTIVELTFTEAGINVLLVNLTCDTAKSINRSTLQFILVLDPLFNNVDIYSDQIVKVYPNPCFDNLNFISNCSSLIKSYDIYDFTGKRIVGSALNNKNNISIQVGNLAKGNYIFRVNYYKGYSKYLNFIKE